MIARFHYDEETLNRLLHDNLREDEHDVSMHVETCEVCQHHIDELARKGMTWDDVGDLLSSVGSHSEIDGSRKLDSRANFLQPSELPESLGRFARYEITEFLGRGGMGIVMRGYDTSLERHCAVKVLSPELATNAPARKRFSREAKSAAAVVHPHVVPIQTVDEFDGLPYLVMPVVEGQSLEARVCATGPLQIVEAIRIAAQIANGLAAAHTQGLVHRDIKPANILLENGIERVQITDFGLARAIDDASMTRSGVIAGTPQYMSPEQAHGDSIDARSDLFSLGSVMYFMLVGRSPFRAETTMGVLNRIGNDQPRSLQTIDPSIPAWLEGIVMKMLAKSPDDRFESAEEVAELLEDCLAHVQQPLKKPLPDSITTLFTNIDVRGKDKSVEGQNIVRKPPIGWLIAVAAVAISLFFAGVLVVLELNKGTLRIESEVDGIPIQIIQGSNVVKKMTVSRTGASTRIAAGEYVVTIDEGVDGIDLKNGVVSLSRQGVEIVRILKKTETIESKSREIENSHEQSIVSQKNLADGKTSQSKESPEFPHVRLVLLDENGKPLPNAKVTLFQAAGKEGSKSVRIDATTNENGVAVERILPFGSYSVTFETAEGWQQTGGTVNVEFGTGLNTTIIAPAPNKKARFTIRSSSELLKRPAVSELRFGELQEHLVGKIGYSTSMAPEPNEDLGEYQTFPTITNGIQQAAVEVRFEIRRTIAQNALNAKGIKSEWKWYSPTDPHSSSRFLVAENALRWCSKVDSLWYGKSIHRRPKQSGTFFKLTKNEHQVGATLLNLNAPQLLPYSFEVPSGDAVAFVTNVYGKPTDEVLNSINWGGHHGRELWLPAAIRFKSQWIQHIVEPGRWTPRTYGDGYSTLVDHLLRQPRRVKPGETFEIVLGGPVSTHDEEKGFDDNRTHRKRPAPFDTPSALMMHAVNCQKRGDLEGWLNCWTDEAAKQLSTSYLMTATMLLEQIESTPLNTRSTNSSKQVEKWKRLIDQELETPEAKATMAALVQATKELAENAGSDLENIAESTTQSPVIQMLAIATAQHLRDPRRFIAKFITLDESVDVAQEFERDDYDFTIEQYGDTATAKFTSDGTTIGLIKTPTGWQIFAPVSTENAAVTTETATENVAVQVIHGQTIEEQRNVTKEGKSAHIVSGKYKISIPGNGEPTVESKDVGIKAHEARSLAEMTLAYNRETQDLRQHLFDPPIPPLSIERIRSALLDAAESYLGQGKLELASALKKSAENNRLDEQLTFTGLTGTMSPGFRQIAPGLIFKTSPNQLMIVVLRRAELRYSRSGWSSKDWGDIHPPITGNWQLMSIKQQGKTLSDELFNQWKQSHANWSRIVINHNSLLMIGDETKKHDFSINYDTGNPLPEFLIGNQGETRYEGVFMSNGFSDNTELHLAIDLEGGSKPKTFNDKDGKATTLSYRRVVESHGMVP